MSHRIVPCNGKLEGRTGQFPRRIVPCARFFLVAFVTLCLGACLAGAVSAATPEVNRLVAEIGDPSQPVRDRLQAIDQLGLLGAEAAPAVPALEALLRDESSLVRAHAADGLGRIGTAAERAVPELIRTMADPEPVVRRKSVESLTRLHPDPEVIVGSFIDLMEDADPAVRLRALDALAEYGESAVPAMIELLEKDRSAYWACLVINEIGPDAKAAIPALIARVSDPRPEVRREAILALGAMGEAAASATDEIAAALDDGLHRVAATYALGLIGRLPDDAKVRIRQNIESSDSLLSIISAWTLARTYPEDRPLQKRAIKRLVTSLESEETEVRAQAAKTLVALELDPELAVPMLREVFQNADQQIVQYALEVAASLGPVMIGQLTGALQFESLRARVAFLLGEMGAAAEPAVDDLLGLLDDPNRETQRAALLALAKIGPAAKDAVPRLIEALKQKEGPCRYGTVYALGRIGPEAQSAKSILLQSTEGDDDVLTLLSAWALAQIAPDCHVCAKRTVPRLIEGLENPRSQNRREAALALAELGPLAQSAVPALEIAAKDPDVDVRAAATAALKAINSQQGGHEGKQERSS